MVKKNVEQESQKAKDLVEAWNLLKCGRDILLANLDLGWESPNNREINKLNRAYIFAKRDFNAALNKYPEVQDKNGLFSGIGSLTAFSNDYMVKWHIGNPIAPEHDNYDFYSGEDYCRSELSKLEEIAILEGAKSMEMPDDANYKATYDIAVEALKDAYAAKELRQNNIEEYSLAWDNMNGRVTINGVYEIVKTQVDVKSSSNSMMRIISEHQKNGETQFEFNFEPAGGKRKTSQIINEDLHITPLMRTIFFDGTWGNKVRFRSPVSREMVLKSSPDLKALYELDLAIKRAEIQKRKDK